MPPLLPRHHRHHAHPVPAAVPGAEGCGAADRYHAEDWGDRRPLRIPGNELFCQDVPGTERLHPFALPGAKTRKTVNFVELFDDFSKPYVVVTFLSVLEMVKGREINIKQDSNFSEIYLERVD